MGLEFVDSRHYFCNCRLWAMKWSARFRSCQSFRVLKSCQEVRNFSIFNESPIGPNMLLMPKFKVGDVVALKSSPERCMTIDEVVQFAFGGQDYQCLDWTESKAGKASHVNKVKVSENALILCVAKPWQSRPWKGCSNLQSLQNVWRFCYSRLFEFSS